MRSENLRHGPHVHGLADSTKRSAWHGVFVAKGFLGNFVRGLRKRVFEKLLDRKASKEQAAIFANGRYGGSAVQASWLNVM